MEETMMMRNDNEKTFVNPSQSGSSNVHAELFECDMCEKRFESKKEVDDHKLKNHNWCKLYDNKFDSKNKLKNHKYTQHSGKYQSDQYIWEMMGVY
jgi:hypothetical protein